MPPPSCFFPGAATGDTSIIVTVKKGLSFGFVFVFIFVFFVCLFFILHEFHHFDFNVLHKIVFI